MGCDIHLITQIKRENKWEYIEDVPEEFNQRNYFNFAVLADVRNGFGTKGFEPKGLPEDLGGKKFGWESEFNHYKDCYEKYSTKMCRLPNGEYISDMDSKLKRYCTREEYETFKGTKGCGDGEYYVYDASVVNGEFVDVPDKELYTFEEYLKKFHEEDFHEEVQDYGRWRVDFSECESDGYYHTPSYLTLKELEEKDYEDIFKEKAKILKAFLDKFFELGGKLPDGMEIDNDWQPTDIRDCFRQAIEPVCIVKWGKNVNKDEIPFFNGIEELKEIAKKYNIDNHDNIRIVFAFDN